MAAKKAAKPKAAPKQKRVNKPKVFIIDTHGQYVDDSKESKLKPYEKITLMQQNKSVFLPDDNVSVVTVNTDCPIGDKLLAPGKESAICGACGLHEHEAENPYMSYNGSEKPLVTVVFEAITPKEDAAGGIALDGTAERVREMIEVNSAETGITLDDVRFVSLTRCANRLKNKNVNLKLKGQYCRLFLVQDLRKYRPKVVMAFGTAALGALSHKSNAQDWGGKILTWRGWPDDWLTNPDYMYTRPARVDAKTGETFQPLTGHPLFGPPPGLDERAILYPVQSPRLIYATRNQRLEKRWALQIQEGLKLAKSGVPPKNYNLPHYHILETPEQVAGALRFIIANPGLLLAYDTETTGLRPWMQQKIVFMMFRYQHPVTGKPVAFGFPWDYEESPLIASIRELTPLVLEAVSVSRTFGHNLSFDLLFTNETLGTKDDYAVLDENGEIREQWRRAQERLNRLANAGEADTWHMAYCFQQQRESLGLEVLAYKFAPDLAGYEEDMTLLIELMRDKLHPENGGHYANCPRDKWETHLKPYVMGDVEVTWQARTGIQAKLDNAKTYKIPLAMPGRPTFFRHFKPPNRAWIYRNIMAPAARVLTKIMGRGMFIDQETMLKLEREMPATIGKLRKEIAKITPEVEEWVQYMVDTDKHKDDKDKTKHWEFDLEQKSQLREILFTQLNLPIQRLTKTGKKWYGEDPTKWLELIRAKMKEERPTITATDLKKESEEELLKFAAMDKFTLNKMAVDHKEVRPLQEYRKYHKWYSTYVRPLRNIFSTEVDKNERKQTQHLCEDGCVHAQFLITGTRSGRLSSRNPNLQNAPRTGEVKSLYASRFGQKGCVYSADFSQIELRLMAAVCGDPSMVDAYWRNLDLHSLTASRIYKVPYEHFGKDYFKWLEKNDRAKEAKDLAQKRVLAKSTNFLTGYGGGAYGLQNVLANSQVYLPIEECEDIIAAFFDSYPSLKDYLGYYKNFIENNGCAVSIFGRVRVFDEVTSDDREAKSKALRAGCNHLIQSTASDMLLICLIVIEDLMRQDKLDSMLVSTVHDSIIIDAVREELPQIHKIVDEVGNNIPQVFKDYLGDDFDTSWMIVPFGIDSEIGLNLGSLRGVPENNVDWDRLLDNKAKDS